ncbi:MAG: aldo/keto reductase [Treponema sp.]|jgi:predicted aldo/keto reductase-like oxidoreductase|nr:aldo/keto reductase [Treponema sp.]
METRRYKETGETVSLLGFGLMRLPLQKEGGQEIDRVRAQEMVDHAIDRGVNYFDTAYMYHEGKSEPFAGEALSKHDRKRFNLATKMPLSFIKTEADVERIFLEQLQKCRVEYFDFYLLHNINQDYLKTAEACRVYEQLKEKQRQGKIRRLGFSFHDRPELLEAVTKKYDWDFAQIQLNYLDWELQNAKEQYQILESRGIPVVIMEPVRGGTLASLCEESVALFKAAAPGASPASWALRFAASLPGVITVLSGMSTMDQLRDNITTMEHFTPLNSEEYRVIEKALAAFRRSGTVPCTACRYCMDCPEGIDIPRALGIYNNYLLATAHRHPMAGFLFDGEYKILGEEKQAHHCIQCNQCSARCPQHINIPRWMKLIDELHGERKSAGSPQEEHPAQSEE